MERKILIVMIIVVFFFFCGQLTAEEVVGESIFPNIETPHPYPKAAEDNTLVWSTTIQEPGAAWIKIHFSEFRLNPNDYVILKDMNGKVSERIRGRDVARKRRSKFNVKIDGDKTVSFWGPAIDGDRVVVGLYSTSNNKKGWGFTIDEVGIGSQPIYNTGVEKNMSIDPFCDSSPQIIQTSSKRYNVDILSSPFGKMLYRKDATWYTCKGSLRAKTGNHFLPSEACIDSQDIVDTLEVRLFIEATTSENVSTLHRYHTYYGGSIAGGGSKFDIIYLTLRNDDKIICLDPNDRGFNKKVPLPKFYVTNDCGCASVTIHDQETLDYWEEITFEPPLDEASAVPSPDEKVLDIDIYAPDENVDWYQMKVNMNQAGELWLAEMEQVAAPSGSQADSVADGISHISAGPWWPWCCAIQKMICDAFQNIFWWFNLNCTGCANNCYGKNMSNPCHSCGIWGMAWLLCIWFGHC